MSILIDRNTRVMTQGITGKTGQFHTQTSRAYANGRDCFVAGVNPKKAVRKKTVKRKTVKKKAVERKVAKKTAKKAGKKKR